MHRLTAFGALIPVTFAAFAFSAPLAAEDLSARAQAASVVPGVAAPPLTAEDLVTLPRLGAPAVNREGTLAVYSVTITDPASLKRSPTHYLIDLARPGNAPVALDLGLKASDLAFGADGALYFLSSEIDEKNAIHLDKQPPTLSRVWRVTLAKDGTAGTPQLVTPSTERDIAGFKLAPNGASIAVWGEVPRDCPTFGCADAATPYLPGPGTGRLYDAKDGFVRHWDRWATPGLHNRIFVYPLTGGGVTGEGQPVDGKDPATGITADTPT